MRVPQIDLNTQHLLLKETILSRLSDLLDSGAFVLGKSVRSFEQTFAEYCGVREAVGVANGTDAIVLTLKALGVGPGDEVITAANTFIATAEAICHAGARPVFVDIDPDTFNLDPARIEEKINPRTKALIPVHLYGQPANLQAILPIAREHSLFVVEDAAQAQGATYQGRRVGSFGQAACFSFYPSKNLGACGDAGAVVTNDEAIALRIRKLRNHGTIQKYEHEMVGFNSRLDAFQAAILSVKLQFLEVWNQKRRQLAACYDAELMGLPGVKLPATLPGVVPAYHQFVIRVPSECRDSLRQFLREQGIDTAVHYPIPVHLTPAMVHLGYARGDFPIAENLAREIMSLPMYAELELEQVQFVAWKLREFMEANQQRLTSSGYAAKAMGVGRS